MFAVLFLSLGILAVIHKKIETAFFVLAGAFLIKLFVVVLLPLFSLWAFSHNKKQAVLGLGVFL
jgi:hypothetical protein